MPGRYRNLNFNDKKYFILVQNNRGPKIEPWGTPSDIGTYLHLQGSIAKIPAKPLKGFMNQEECASFATLPLSRSISSFNNVKSGRSKGC